MMPDLTETLPLTISPAFLRTASERQYLALLLTSGVRRSTVSRL